MEKTKENKMKIEEIKKVNDSISNEDMEKKIRRTNCRISSC